MNSRLLFAIIVFLSAFASANSIDSNVQDAAQRIAGTDYLPGLRIEYIGPQKAQAVQWARANWQGPIGGAIIALSSSGEVFGGLEVGAIEKWHLLQIPGIAQPSVWAEYVVGVGTSGYLYKKVGVFGIIDRHVTELWSHDALARWFETCDQNEEYQFTAVLDPGGTRISVRGTRTIRIKEKHGDDCIVISTRSEELPPEQYCWTGKDAFKKCP